MNNLLLSVIILGVIVMGLSFINSADATRSDLFINYLSKIIWNDCQGKDIHINQPIVRYAETNQTVSIIPWGSYSLDNVKQIIGVFGNENYNTIMGTCQGGTRLTAQGLINGCGILTCGGNDLDIIQFTYFWNKVQVDVPKEDFQTFGNNSPIVNSVNNSQITFGNSSPIIQPSGEKSPVIVGNSNTINQNDTNIFVQLFLSEGTIGGIIISIISVLTYIIMKMLKKKKSRKKYDP